MSDKVYLGDSVYAEFDTQIAGDVVLTTENGYGPSNTIYLEPDILTSLSKIRGARAERAGEAAPQDEWRPIETAPKDGRTLLLGYFNALGKWRTLRGKWFSDEEISDWENDCFEAWWYETSVENDDLPNCWMTNPTHWMPLPAPPKPSRPAESQGDYFEGVNEGFSAASNKVRSVLISAQSILSLLYHREKSRLTEQSRQDVYASLLEVEQAIKEMEQ